MPEIPMYDPSYIRTLFEQMNLEVLAFDHMDVDTTRLDVMLLNLITQNSMSLIIAYFLEIGEGDREAMVTGSLDFLEAGQKILDEKYGGEIKQTCLIAVGRKAA